MVQLASHAYEPVLTDSNEEVKFVVKVEVAAKGERNFLIVHTLKSNPIFNTILFFFNFSLLT